MLTILTIIGTAAYVSIGTAVGQKLSRRDSQGWDHPVPVFGSLFWPLIVPVLIGMAVDKHLVDRSKRKGLPEARVL